MKRPPLLPAGRLSCRRPRSRAAARPGCRAGGRSRVTVSQDFGAAAAADAAPGRGETDDLALLERSFEATRPTAREEIGGVAGGRRRQAGRVVLLRQRRSRPTRRAARRKLYPGDRIWWDHHGRASRRRCRRSSGRSRSRSARAWTARSCRSGSVCTVPRGPLVRRGRDAAQRPASSASRGRTSSTWPGDETMRVLVGTWSELRKDRAAARTLEAGPRARRVRPLQRRRRRRSTCSTPTATPRKTLGAGAGLVAATRYERARADLDHHRHRRRRRRRRPPRALTRTCCATASRWRSTTTAASRCRRGAVSQVRVPAACGVGVPKETARTVSGASALVPEVVRKLVARDLEVVVEPGAGLTACSRTRRSPTRARRSATRGAPRWCVKVAPPGAEEIARLDRRLVLVGFLAPLATRADGRRRSRPRG